jgi:hypothetical protein
MNPSLTQATAEQRIAELRREAAAYRRAAAARASHGQPADGSRAHAAARLIRSLGRRRYREIELVWPDGVRTVVPTKPGDSTRPLASSRR